MYQSSHQQTAPHLPADECILKFIDNIRSWMEAFGRPSESWETLSCNPERAQQDVYTAFFPLFLELEAFISFLS
jgi:hypothetical protein